jgi:hypothetical protein
MVALVRESLLKISGQERRRSTRTAVQQQLPCRRLSYSAEARRQPDILLDTLDLSECGLGAMCDIPLAPGEQVVLRFSPMSIPHRRTIWGTVRRCEPSAQGFHIGIAFGTAPAAA